jgi:hypothetical protein
MACPVFPVALSGILLDESRRRPFLGTLQASRCAGTFTDAKKQQLYHGRSRCSGTRSHYWQGTAKGEMGN